MFDPLHQFEIQSLFFNEKNKMLIKNALLIALISTISLSPASAMDGDVDFVEKPSPRSPLRSFNDKESCETLYHLGLKFYHEQKYAEAFEPFHKSANQGHADAQFNLGVFYFKGQAVTQSYVEAVKWFLKSANQEHADAQFNLGVIYANGQGVKQSNSEAVKWYRKAAHQGHADAQLNLGLLYFKGQGVKQSHFKAVKWFRKSAHQGHADAQLNLGVLYCKGQGVRQSYAKALKWLGKAANQGHAGAQLNLEIIQKRIDIKAPASSVSKRGYTPPEKISIPLISVCAPSRKSESTLEKQQGCCNSCTLF